MVDNELVQRFVRWLTERVGTSEMHLEAHLTPGHGGFSNETHVLALRDASGAQHDLVLRLAPEGGGIFPTYDLDRQADVLDMLAKRSDVPVPLVRWREPDASVLGRPFYVMERVAGRIPPDRPGYLFEGWVKDAAAQEQARVLDAGLEMMARIHRVDVDAAGLTFLDRPRHGAGAIEQEIGYWRAYLDWAGKGERFDVLETIYEWCVAHRPTEPTSRGLVWGDARLGNLIYADDASIRAVMDWEMAVLGPPELDLGWHLFLERIMQQFAKPLPGFGTADDMVAKYEAHLGRSLEHLDWYETWGGFRAACIQLPLTTIQHAKGEPIDLSYRVDNPLITELLRRIA
ncbi:MAG: phosphotransferase family protein [Actinobacteria bacterium]|nr:phosphotransferase family protein [Actinomycetota bacterium]